MAWEARQNKDDAAIVWAAHAILAALRLDANANIAAVPPSLSDIDWSAAMLAHLRRHAFRREPLIEESVMLGCSHLIHLVQEPLAEVYRKQAKILRARYPDAP